MVSLPNRRLPDLLRVPGRVPAMAHLCVPLNTSGAPLANHSPPSPEPQHLRFLLRESLSPQTPRAPSSPPYLNSEASPGSPYKLATLPGHLAQSEHRWGRLLPLATTAMRAPQGGALSVCPWGRFPASARLTHGPDHSLWCRCPVRGGMLSGGPASTRYVPARPHLSPDTVTCPLEDKAAPR